MRGIELLEQVRWAIPEHRKVELSGDMVVIQPSPSALHQRNLAIVQEQFDAHRPTGYFPSGNSDLAAVAVSKVRNPDLTYVPDDVVELPEHDIPAALALVAVEMVSPRNPENDWVGKLRDYPVMGIPLYLIVDARAKTVTLFSEPENGRYRSREDADFGETIRIPAPFDFVLETASLLPIID
ncbi:Uma2 family endonuclease [Streptacidiphilus fuscans]|uniref:Uma2 family endonuclease n=1 Tax=Streptacidiphilus fuscans TaxID=2789292 RepID=A0A931AW70_9ACTN|nr:Uma2 family endonuclease [Streptacidiphilus fuscans]MBF9066599.1 Uma2 family endonuclease [Streptacidiphilus fuscans]